jgi:hypothetical protein
LAVVKEMRHRSKIIVILLEVLEAHLVLVDLRVLEAVLDLVQSYLAPDGLEHRHHVFRHQVALPELKTHNLSLSRW